MQAPDFVWFEHVGVLRDVLKVDSVEPGGLPPA